VFVYKELVGDGRCSAVQAPDGDVSCSVGCGGWEHASRASMVWVNLMQSDGRWEMGD
jgi:hypothetical protein